MRKRAGDDPSQISSVYAFAKIRAKRLRAIKAADTSQSVRCSRASFSLWRMAMAAAITAAINRKVLRAEAKWGAIAAMRSDILNKRTKRRSAMRVGSWLGGF